MSDANTSLPVRTEQNGDIQAKISDGTTPSQFLAVDSTGRIVVKLDDGAGNAITSQVNGAQRALDVGVNVAGVQVDPRAIRALTAADVVTSNQGAPNTAANGWFVKLTDGTDNAQILATGELTVAVTQPLPAGTNVIGSVNQGTSPWITKDQSDGPVTPGTVASFSSLIGGQFNTSLPTLTTGQQAAVQLDAAGRILVGSIFSPLPAGTNNIGKVSIQDSTGAAITTTNPLPVTVTVGVPGTEVHNYNTAASVAANGTSNHTYTITALKTLKAEKFWASASGKLKIEVQTSVDGVTFVTKFVGFNSTANPNIDIFLGQFTLSDSGTGSQVRIIRTNLDKSAMDVYSTISAVEI